jgi:hypothetical protein
MKWHVSWTAAVLSRSSHDASHGLEISCDCTNTDMLRLGTGLVGGLRH